MTNSSILNKKTSLKSNFDDVQSQQAFKNITLAKRLIIFINECIEIQVLANNFKRVSVGFIISFLCLASYNNSAKGEHINLPPYGVIFGQQFDAEKHEHIRRRRNIQSVKLKDVNRPKNTEELRAEICDRYGLQIITWRSQLGSLEISKKRDTEITVKFINKFGPPNLKNKSTIWKISEFDIVTKIREQNKEYQNQIRYFGPQNRVCLQELVTNTNQSE